MRLQNTGGDTLARGGVRAQFNPSRTTTQELWNAAFDDFDPEKYRSDAGVEETGDGSAGTGEDSAVLGSE